MKKLLMMMMCVSLLAGCTTGDDNDDKNDTSNNNNDIVEQDKDNTNTNTSDGWYNRFETALKDQNVNYTNRSEIDATSIGGVEGYRYTTNNGNVDVYRFEDGDDLNKIMKDKKINVDDKDYNVEVRDRMVIVTDNLADDVRDIFRGMK